ncbi:MAG TPA: EAL domain-containing protein [Sulfuricurvum sp.]|nr:EAL domain-containing protein [Sulfuricurvum sp.]
MNTNVWLSPFKHYFNLHPTHYPAMRHVALAIAIMAAAMISIIFLPSMVETRGLKDYLPLHTALEMSSIIIAMLIFAVGWNPYSNKLPSNITLLSILFFGVAVFDFSHTMSYTGMPDFVTPSGVEKGIYFWLAARLLSSVGLLLFLFIPIRPLRSNIYNYLLFGVIVTLIAIVHWVVFYHQELIHHTLFIEGEGLTLLKIYTEYTIISLNLVAAVVLLHRMRKPQSYHAPALFGALCIMAMSEFFFTLYAHVSDVYNIFGHIYKSVAFLFVYRAIFITTVEKPYKELHDSQNQLNDKNHLLHTIIENIPNMIFLKDAQELRYKLFNKAGETLLGLDRNTLLGHNDYDLFPKEQAEFFTHKDRETLQLHKVVDIPEELIETAQGTRILHTKKIAIDNAHGEPLYLLGISEDISERKKAQASIERLAHFDQLTDLPNRVMLYDRVKYLLNMAERNEEPMAVMYLDLDHFKNINDTLGHSIGDKLLIEIGKRLLSTIRSEDTASRVGGDEFIMLFPNTDSNAAMHIASKIIASISVPNIIEHHELTVTPSIGIAMYPNDGHDFETLLKNADTAMYRVKQDSRNNFNFFTQEMQLHSARNLQLNNALRHALERNELQLHYQPQISIQDGRIIGAEALIRWNHPEMGMISPAEFIPIAEESGQIISIGEWVLRTAAQKMKELYEEGFHEMVMAVNLSAIQFRQANLLDIVTGVLNEIQLPSRCLELELTEAVAMYNPKTAINIMNSLHEKNIRMSIDDFGTGYSSLSYLKKFKVYKLKIDQSFIRDIAKDPDDRAIVSAIIDMASNLGIQTIAEGVETAEQLAFLRLHGCNEAQGYYFSKPLPAEEFTLFVRNAYTF